MTPECFKVPALSNMEVYALRALESGEATPHEQRLALAAILKKLCRSYDQHFVPESDRETVFLEGRGFVGQQILKFLRLDANQLKALTEDRKDV